MGTTNDNDASRDGNGALARNMHLDNDTAKCRVSEKPCMNEDDSELDCVSLEDDTTECERAVDIEPCATSADNSVPHVGMQFKTADDAYIWYNDYAMRMGFSVRKDRQEKSKRDGEVISRLFVCSKEGKRRDKDPDKENTEKPEQLHTRVGCEAYFMVKRRKRGTPEGFWVVTRFGEHHNHDLVSPAKVQTLRSHRKRGRSTARLRGANYSSSLADSNAIEIAELQKNVSGKGHETLEKGDDSTAVDYCGDVASDDPEVMSEDNPGPRLGMQFRSADEAYAWYVDYATWVGFNVRIDRQEKSKRDGIVISRLFVCSKQGKRRDKYLNKEKRSKVEQVETRVGCQAYLMVKRRRGPAEDSWEVTRFQERHNHPLMSPSRCGKRKTKLPEANGMTTSDVERCFKDIFEGEKSESRTGQLNIPSTGSIPEENIGEGNHMGQSNNEITFHGHQDMGNGVFPSNRSGKTKSDKRKKGTRSCSVCKKRDHNKRKCPTLNAIGDMQQPESVSHPDILDSEIMKDRLPNGVLYSDFAHHRSGIFRQTTSDIGLSFYFGD